jgi:hypothetical protein
VAFFTVTPGSISHVTQPLTRDVTVNISGADSWEWLPDNRLKLTVQLKRNDARIVFVQPV